MDAIMDALLEHWRDKDAVAVAGIAVHHGMTIGGWRVLAGAGLGPPTFLFEQEARDRTGWISNVVAENHKLLCRRG